MRISTLLMIVGILQAEAADIYSQKTRISLDIKDTKLYSVLDKIEQESEFYFLYNEKLLDTHRLVSISAKDELISDILDNLFARTDVKYAIIDRKIILAPGYLGRDIKASDINQQIKITGKVTDDLTGEAIIGANVVIEGTNIGVISDVNGNFSIDVPNTNSILVFSSIGYLTEKIQINGQTKLEIKLVSDIQKLEEVVVVGYGTMLKKNVSTAVAKVTVDDISKAGNSNMAQLMLGRASGLTASMVSAQPGGKIDISIRGAGEPTYVIDGVITPGNSLEPGTGSTIPLYNNVDRSGLAGLNPEDIESIEILKDASASIYGIGAANGVVLITTKKGKEGKLSVTYDGSQSIVDNYPYLQPLNSQQFMGLVNIHSKEAYLYNKKLAPYGPTEYSSGWTPVYDDATISSAETTDWLDMVLRRGKISNHNLSINGGNKIITYRVSGNYFSQTGTVSNSKMDRFALRSNVSAQLAPFIRLNSVVNVNRNIYNNSTVGGTDVGSQGSGSLSAALIYPPNLPVKDENGVYSLYMATPNPIAVEDIKDKTLNNGLFLKFDADFTLIKDMLSAKLLFGDNLENASRSTYIPSYVYFNQTYQSRGNLGYDVRENRTIEATMNFNKKISVFDIGALLGVGRYYSLGHGLNTSYTGQHDAIGNDNLGSVTGVVTPGSYRTGDERRSQFFRLSIDILDRYVINATIRNDGTDKFFPEKKYALFPSVAAAWKINNESFMEGISWIRLLKVRASYGTTGSDNLGTLLYGTYGPNPLIVMFDNNTQKFVPIIANGLDYPDVTWQKTTMKNIGIDFSLFSDRVSGNFDIYRNDVTDLLGEDNTPGLSMFGLYPLNGAQIRREGWDAGISTKNIQGAKFTWNSILNMTRYNSLWISRFSNYDYQIYESKGETPTNARYYYETNGIVNIDKSNMPASQPAELQYPGCQIYADRNGDGSITIDDIKMDNLIPKLYLGFGNTFRYGHFDLDIFMYSQVGMKKFSYALGWVSAGQLSKPEAQGNTNTYAYRLWNSQDNPNGTLPGVADAYSQYISPGNVGTDFGYQNASFLRIRNITLGYNISGSQIGDAFRAINNIRIYVDTQNPFTFTKYEGFDPEIRTGGNAWGLDAEYPMTRTFTVGLKVSL